LLVYLAKKNIIMNYDNVTIEVNKDDKGEDRIVLTEEYNDGVLS
jgi:hypothetical protein